MLRPETRRALDAYWSNFFGCDAAGLRPPAPTVLPRTGEEGSRGVYAMEFGAAPVALLPAGLIDRHGARVGDLLSRGLSDDAIAWRGIFGDAVEAVIGPAALRYADEHSFRPLPFAAAARLLTPDELPAAEALRRACAAVEWEHGGSDVLHEVTAGVFVGDELAAIAGYEEWGGVIAHVSIVSHPAHRGRGHAAAAVSRITARALERGLIAQYRTLEANAPSVAVAQRLGFQLYARSVAVRLSGR